MHDYDNDYVFIHLPSGGGVPLLVPDAATADRGFRYRAQVPGSPPLVFSNGWREAKGCVNASKQVPQMLFAGADLVVRSAVRERLEAHRITGLHMHQAVYVDAAGSRHDNYWYLTFTDRLDCWDRDLSHFARDRAPVYAAGVALFRIYRYCLDPALLDRIPVGKRLLFRMGGCLQGHVTCHRTLLPLFPHGADSGAAFTPVPAYRATPMPQPSRRR